MISKSKNESRVLWQFDSETWENRQGVVDLLGGSLGGFVITLDLLFKVSLVAAIKELKLIGQKWGVDYKFLYFGLINDIPVTVSNTVQSLPDDLWGFCVKSQYGNDQMDLLSTSQVIASAAKAKKPGTLLFGRSINKTHPSPNSVGFGLNGLVCDIAHLPYLKKNLEGRGILIGAHHFDSKLSEVISLGADYVICEGPYNFWDISQEEFIAETERIKELIRERRKQE